MQRPRYKKALRWHLALAVRQFRAPVWPMVCLIENKKSYLVLINTNIYNQRHGDGDGFSPRSQRELFDRNDDTPIDDADAITPVAISQFF